jgi:hypothetical protein
MAFPGFSKRRHADRARGPWRRGAGRAALDDRNLRGPVRRRETRPRLLGLEHDRRRPGFCLHAVGMPTSNPVSAISGWRAPRLSASCGYVISGKLARTRPGWEVISWALVVTAPLSLAGVALQLGQRRHAIPMPSGLTAFTYLSLGSMFAGFIFWNWGWPSAASPGSARCSCRVCRAFVTLGRSSLRFCWAKQSQVRPAPHDARFRARSRIGLVWGADCGRKAKNFSGSTHPHNLKALKKPWRAIID